MESLPSPWLPSPRLLVLFLIIDTCNDPLDSQEEGVLSIDLGPVNTWVDQLLHFNRSKNFWSIIKDGECVTKYGGGREDDYWV